MSRWRRVAAALAMLSVAASLALAQAPATARFGFGKPATPEEIAGWDIDVRPDGKGLPPGRGSVAQGQVLYDAQCASCHGTFGESTDYMPIAGGVGSLRTDQPIRTTGSKLNHATTLWDYINRAMPLQAPKTLKPDEVYALTAYVLNLNQILPADAVLDPVSIVALKMPNRDGFTLQHGLGSRRAQPDTRNVACMKDCVREVRVSSELPEHARDAHGDLAEQQRPWGPLQGTQIVAGNVSARTTLAAVPGGPPRAAAPAGAPAPAASGAELAKAAGCLACHGVANRIVGPSLREIAGRHARAPGAETQLLARVREGGSGAWGSIPMPPQPQVKEADARAIVGWILEGAK